MSAGQWPSGLEPLLREKFFIKCQLHPSHCDYYCMKCVTVAFCLSCKDGHSDHDSDVVQIRKKSYHDAVKVVEMQRVVDISRVQTHILNNEKVVYLNARPDPKNRRDFPYKCQVCGRSLPDSCCFCSLGCMIAGASKRKLPLETETKDSCSRGTPSIHPNEQNEAPPVATSSKSSHKRRKGIPHRSPFL